MMDNFGHPVTGNAVGGFGWEEPENTDGENNISAAVNQISDTTRQKVDEEIHICVQELRARINSILDEQRMNTEYFLGVDNPHPFQQPSVDSEVYYPQPLAVEQVGERPAAYANENDNILETQSSDYFTCEPDNSSDLSMHSAHYSEEMIENRKNLYVMRILTSVMKIHNMLTEGDKLNKKVSTHNDM